MIIQHNLAAMNANRQFGVVNRKKDKNTEKLSSGYRVNRAADDAAGLAISEKMRRQIRGLTQASKNAQDGISLVQVADGALNEMHDNLQRINELCVKAANGTLTDQDRGYVQSEVSQIIAEINRICTDTRFNEIPIFASEFKLVGIDAPDYTNVKFNDPVTIAGQKLSNSKAMSFANINEDSIEELVGKSFSAFCSLNCGQEFKFSFTDSGGSHSSLVTTANPKRPNIDVVIDITGMKTGTDVVNAVYSETAKLNDGIYNADTISAKPKPGGASDTTSSIYIGHANGLSRSGDRLIFLGLGGGGGGIDAGQLDSRDAIINLQVGSEAGQTIPVKLYSMNASKIGISGINVSTRTGAENGISAVKSAIELVSSRRTYYGAIQNRLEHTIKNLDNVVENTTAAESTIRDTDMAKYMVDYSNDNILSQAGIAMMSQANQANSSVLSLLA